jgi:hypothetical protein
MMKNAEIPRPWILWLLTPMMMLSTYFVFLHSSDQWSLSSVLVVSIFVLMSVGLLVASLVPDKGRWGIRLVAFLIFLAYFAYLVAEFIFEFKTFELAGDRSEPSPFNALLGFLLFGIPCLNYSIWGSVWGRVGHQDVVELTLKDVIAYHLMRGAYWLFAILSTVASVFIIWQAL